MVDKHEIFFQSVDLNNEAMEMTKKKRYKEAEKLYKESLR
jgi:hypothetical protein